jgi:hypothetical protein
MPVECHYATQNDELSNAIRTIGDSMAKASDVRANSIIRVNYVRIQSLEAGLRRLLRDLDRAGLRDAFDMSIFDYLNDSLCEAALLVEDKGEKNNGNG